jgi:hypothetical protein
VTRTALLDVNLLLALFDSEHVHHEIAHDWFADDGSAGWATCSVTESGLVRLLTNPGYVGAVIRPVEAVERLRAFCASGHHVFWDRSISLRDESLFEPALIRGHRQITDIYLLGLAMAMGGRLATLDHHIPLGAVVGATPDALAVIGPADSE